MALMPHQTCAICLFWNREDRGARHAPCQRNPPAVVPDTVEGGYAERWPITVNTDWCGEWAPDK